jgi:hypothetical protein
VAEQADTYYTGMRGTSIMGDGSGMRKLEEKRLIKIIISNRVKLILYLAMS